MFLMPVGCGKTDDQPTRFNQTLGGTPVGAPAGTGPIDTGILKDPADYKPTPYESLEGGAPGGGAEGAEAEEIRGVLSELVAAIFDIDLEMVLDACVPEQVAALSEEDEYIDSFDEMKDALVSFVQIFSDKATGPKLEAIARLFELLPELAEPLTNAFTISVLDEENAVATFDPSRLEIPEELRTTLAEVMQAGAAMVAQMGAAGMMGGGMPGAAEAGLPAGGFSPEMLDELPSVQIPLPLRKVDDVWRLVLPFTIEEQHAELINEAALVVKDLFADLAQAIDQVETLDEQTSAQIDMQVGMRHMGPIMGLVGRATAMFAPMTEGEPAAEEEAATTEGDETESNEPEEESAETPPAGRRP